MDKWQKKGLIFNSNKNFDWMQSHAALPYAKNLKRDIFRVYFTTRDIHNRSHTAFVDININNPSKILNISKKPILKPGNLGCFDDSGAMGCCLVDYNKSRYMYYVGWNLGVLVPFRYSIGLAIGNNSIKENYKKIDGPILDRSIYDPCLIASPFVIRENEKWKMWYVSGVKWELEGTIPKHYYHIKYAESEDGINWIRVGKVCIDFKSKKEYAFSRPCVIKENEIYKMWYSYRGQKYRIGYAESQDGIKWKRLDKKAGIDVSSEGWDSDMIEYPFVFDHGNKRYMLYNGNGYGKTGFGYAAKSIEG